MSIATAQGTVGRNGPGRILTFYSYKGGTGRSMALANVAWMLALNNQRVLVIDWDLEAPGVHRYFHPFLDDKELQSTRGLIDFVEDLAARSAVSPEPLADSEADVSSYVTSLDRPGWDWEQFGERAGIDLLAAGQQNAGYSRKVNSFNWISFYQNLGGRRFLAYMAARLREIYDYILIDSRTGVSDTSGICTVEMPDTVVVCFTLNEQSIRGAANVLESIVSQRNVRDEEKKLKKLQPGDAPPTPLRIYPIPTRIELSEYTKRQVALDLVRKIFSRYLGDLSQAELGRYWGNLQMQYVPIYAFEEVPAVFGDSPYDQSSLSAFVGRLTRVLANDNSFSLQFLADDIRLEVFGWYQRASEIVLDSAQLAEAAFEQFGDELQQDAIQVLLRLVQFTPSGFSPQVLAREELQRGLSDGADALIKARILRSVGTQSGQVLQLADPAILQTWAAYEKWIKEDLLFLQWRQSINTAARSWSLASRRESGLLREDSLEEARNYVRLRSDELNEDERQYISASVERDERRRALEELSRTNRDKLEEELAHLKTELSAAKLAPAKADHDPEKPKYRSWGLILAVFLGFLLVMVAVMFVLQYRNQNEQNRMMQEQRQVAANAQQQQAAEVENLKRQLAEKQPAYQPALSKPPTVTPKTGNKPSKPTVKGAVPTTSTNNPGPATCRILPRSGGNIAPGELSLSVDDRPVGSITNSTGLDFACIEGMHRWQMQPEGAPACDGSVMVLRGKNIFNAYYFSTGKDSKCNLERVAAAQ